uniref:Retrotransposon gag domain-containing protein n=1 Tax=Tanacetum cinerariifolium TaxID=118510 RepID=A0A699JJ56_TANCI|nr:hypothetical protein [Tanacetum cinerariifolium]GFA41036.1 hypothetical protein [Tanacetum cinerariifolium]
MIGSSTNELFTPFENSKREFRSSRKLFKTLGLDKSSSPKFNLFYYIEENFEEEVTETMAETMEQYMSKTQANYGSSVTRPKINDKDHFELKGQFLKELRDNTFNGSDHEDANRHIEKVLKIVDLLHIPNITQDQIMLRAFLMSLTRVTSLWLRNKPSGSIKTWEDLKVKFICKYCPPAQNEKKMEEINNFHQEPDETLYQEWERFKKTLNELPSTLFNGNAREYSQKWYNRTSRTRSTETSDELAAIQAQLNNLGREIKNVNEKIYAAQVELRDSTDTASRNQGALIKALEIQNGKMSKVMQEGGSRSLPISTKTNPRDHVNSVSTIFETDTTLICRIESTQFAVPAQQNSKPIFKPRQAIVPFPSRLYDDCYDESKGSYGLKHLDAYLIGTTLRNDSLPKK